MSKHTVFLDLETTSLSPHEGVIRLIQYMDQDGGIKVFDVWKEPKRIKQLINICENPEIRKVWMNASFDMGFIRVAAGRRVRFVNQVDLMLSEQVLLAGWFVPYLDHKSGDMKKKMPMFSLKDMVWRHLGIKLDKTQQKSDWSAPHLSEAQMQYAGEDVRIMQPLYNIQCELLKLNKLEDVAELEYQTIPAIVEMQVSGMPLDVSATEAMIVLKSAERDETLRELNQMIIKSQKSRQMTLLGVESDKADMNMSSPAQVVKKLRELGYQVKNADVEVLREIDHPWAAKLLEYRTVERQLNFLDQWLNKHGGKKNGRIYPYYAQNRAATGRMSSNNPNAQQIPKRQKGPSFRKLFKAAPGYKIVKADFAQVELRVVAAVSGDKVMIDSIKNGVDLHTLTAANMAGIDPKDVTKTQRFNAKAVNFGLAYGMSAKTLKKYAKLNYSVDMSEDEAYAAHKTYHDLYAGLTKWHAETSRRVKKEVYDYHMHTYDKGFFVQKVFSTETLFRRKRYWADWGGETLAKLTDATNTPIQGSSADITKLVLAELYKSLPEEVKIIGVIHDEVLLESPDALAEDAGLLMLEIMRRVGSEVASPVPIDAELEIHQSWGGD